MIPVVSSFSGSMISRFDNAISISVGDAFPSFCKRLVKSDSCWLAFKSAETRN